MNFFIKILKVIAVISGFLTITHWGFYAFIKYKYALDVAGAASIGIIGGADGPTSIFVATKTPGFLDVFLKSCPFIAFISTIVLLAKRIQNNRAN